MRLKREFIVVFVFRSLCLGGTEYRILVTKSPPLKPQGPTLRKENLGSSYLSDLLWTGWTRRCTVLCVGKLNGVTAIFLATLKMKVRLHECSARLMKLCSAVKMSDCSCSGVTSRQCWIITSFRVLMSHLLLKV